MAATAAQPNSIARWIPSLPAMLINPFGGESDNNTNNNTNGIVNGLKDAHQSNGIAHGHTSAESRPPLHSAFSFADSEPSPSPSRTSRSSFFAEPETTSSISAGSREGSIDGKRLGKSRPKTQFSVCHPPPESRTRQRLHRRPRSLLQLHRLRDAARPMPAFEVVPSTNFSLSLNAAVTRIFKTKHGLCPSDLVVLKAEKYTMPNDEEDEDKEARDVIGLICKGRKEEDKVGSKAKIVMADGKTWDAYPISNGGYEFHSVGKNGLALTVRWVPKRNKDGIVVSKDGSRRFNFSTISPNSRRHPVIASMSKTAMDINDSYRLPDATPATPLGTPKVSSTILEDAMDEEIDRQTCETDPHLRELITITSIFVTFREGWSPSFKYDDKDHVSKFGPHSPTKSLGTPIASPPGSPALTPKFHPPPEERGSIKSIGSGIIRRTSVLTKSNRNSIISNSEDEHHNTSPSRSNSIAKTGRPRADSSSTVLVHRAASNRRKNNQQWRPELLGAQTTLQENSKEDLGRMSASKNRSLKSSSPLAGVETTDGSPAVAGSRQSSVEKKDEEEHRQSITTMGSVNGTGRKKKQKQKKKEEKSWRLRSLFCGSRDAS